MSTSTKVILVLLLIGVVFVVVMVVALSRQDGDQKTQERKAEDFKKGFEGAMKAARDWLGDRAVPKVDLSKVRVECGGNQVVLRRGESRMFTGTCQATILGDRGEGFVSLTLTRTGPILIECKRYGDETDGDKLGGTKPPDPKKLDFELIVPKDKGGVFVLTCPPPPGPQPCAIKPK